MKGKVFVYVFYGADVLLLHSFSLWLKLHTAVFKWLTLVTILCWESNVYTGSYP